MLTESNGPTVELADLLIDNIYVYLDKRADVAFKIKDSFTSHEWGEELIIYGLHFITEKAAHFFAVCCRKKRSDFMPFLPLNGNGRRQNSYHKSWIMEIRKNNYFLSCAWHKGVLVCGNGTPLTLALSSPLSGRLFLRWQEVQDSHLPSNIQRKFPYSPLAHLLSFPSCNTHNEPCSFP